MASRDRILPAVNPARAGMILARSITSAVMNRKPRASGDDPGEKGADGIDGE